jgi:hypothetical protein
MHTVQLATSTRIKARNAYCVASNKALVSKQGMHTVRFETLLVTRTEASTSEYQHCHTCAFCRLYQAPGPRAS